MKLLKWVGATLVMSAAAGAQAQSLKPGLWEISQKMQSSGGAMEQKMAQAQAQMAALPPEQRKMMQDMMARQGVSMGGGGAVSVKTCITKEMADRNEVPAQAQGNCKSTSSPMGGNAMKVAFTCTSPPSSGDGVVTFTSPQAYTVKMTVNTTVQGKPEKINMDGAGTWLGADCGSIKPPGAPAK